MGFRVSHWRARTTDCLALRQLEELEEHTQDAYPSLGALLPRFGNRTAALDGLGHPALRAVEAAADITEGGGAMAALLRKEAVVEAAATFRPSLVEGRSLGLLRSAFQWERGLRALARPRPLPQAAAV